MNDKEVTIKIELSKKMLNEIEEKIQGRNRNEKIVEAVRIGYEISKKLNPHKKKTLKVITI
jgi:metal-responsive CopG/Arc/MetJ family transcriptional regulator